MLRLTFWMNMPSFYQGDLFRAIVKTGKVDLRVVFSQRLPPDRSRLGWADDVSQFEHRFLNPKTPITDAIKIARAERNRTHIVGGLWAGPIVKAVLPTLMASGAEYYIYSEAPDSRYPVSPWKRMVLRFGGKTVVKNAQGILSVSHFAHSYFCEYGANITSIYPFAYFRSVPQKPGPQSRSKKGNRLDVVFLGQLIQRKGVDILLSAVEPLLKSRRNLSLQIIGSGELDQQLRARVTERNLDRQVTFEGSLSPLKVLDRIAEADLLVLPSRWDGWGIVVNEAFMASVPVIVSSMCGAADLVSNGRNGFVFSSEDVQDLRIKLDQFVFDRRLQKEMKLEAKRTGALLEADNAAEYLVTILENPRGGMILSAEQYPWMGRENKF